MSKILLMKLGTLLKTTNQYEDITMLDHKYIEYLERDNIDLLNKLVQSEEQNKQRDIDIQYIMDEMNTLKNSIDNLKYYYNCSIIDTKNTLSNLLNIHELPSDIGIEINDLLVRLMPLS